MGFYMPPYSAWLLYGTTLLYTIGFLFLAIYRHLKETENFWEAHNFKGLIIGIGIATAVNGIGFQVSNVQIAPEITVLVQALALPINWLLSFLFKKRVPTFRKAICMAVILAGALFGVIYPLVHSATGSLDQFNNGAGWVLMSIIGSIANAFQNVLQDIAYEKKCPKAATLFYYNFFSLIVYFFWLFAQLTQKFGTCIVGFPPLSNCQNVMVACNDTEAVFSHEANAWKCYFSGGYADVPCCGNYQAFLWVTLFVVGYVVAFALCADVLDSTKSNTDGTTSAGNIQALTIFGSAFFFWWPWAAGLGYSQPEWSTGVSALIVGAGTLSYELFGAG